MPGFIVPLDIQNDINTGEEDRSDYRPVPASDQGNAAYRDRGMLGFYQTDDKPFRPPSDVKYEAGYGATQADLERGWSEPLITQHPAYQLSNYKDRSSQPMVSDVAQDNVEMMEAEWSFRERNRKSRGFLTRPRIPTER